MAEYSPSQLGKKLQTLAQSRQTLPGAFDLSQKTHVGTDEFRFAGIDHARTPLDNNKTMDGVHAQTEDYEKNVLSRIYRWVMHARWAVMHASAERFSRDTGIASASVRNLSHAWTGERWNSRDAMSLAYGHFAQQESVSFAAREQLLGLLEEHHQSLLPDPRFAMVAWYRSVGYEKGFDVFDKSSGLTESQVNERQNGKMQPRFLEVLQVTQAMYPDDERVRELRLGHARRVWELCDKAERSRKGFTPGHVRVIQALEMRLANDHEAPMGVEHLYNHLHMPRLLARALLAGKNMSPEACLQLAKYAAMDVRKDASRERFLRSFALAYDVTEISSRISFDEAMEEVMRQKNVTTAQLVEWLEVPSHTKGNNKARHRNRLQTVRGALRTGNSFLAPVAAMCACLRLDAEAAARLRSVHHAERREVYFKATGTHHEGIDLAIARDWYGVTTEELAKMKRLQTKSEQTQTQNEIVELERRKEPLTDEEKQLAEFWSQQLTVLGEARCAQALGKRERSETGKCVATVDEAMELALKHFSGEKTKAFAAFIAKKTKDRQLRLGSGMLYRTWRKEEYPALPVLKHVLGLKGVKLNEDMIRDWHVVFPQRLQHEDRAHMRVTKPLARMLLTVALRAFPTLQRASQAMGMSESPLSACIKQAENGGAVSEQTVQKLLEAAGVRAHAFAGIVMRELREGVSLSYALQTACREKKKDLRSITLNDVPGILEAELASVQTAPVILVTHEKQASVSEFEAVNCEGCMYQKGVVRVSLQELQARAKRGVSLFTKSDVQDLSLE